MRSRQVFSGVGKRATVTLLLSLVCWRCGTLAFGQDRVAVSVKHILDLDRNRSIGDYTEDEQIREAISEANRILENNQSRWRLSLEEIVEVDGASPFFRINSEGHLLTLETTAMREREKYAWRSEAINIYIADHLITSGTRGISSFPVQLENRTREIIALNNRGLRRGGIGWLHEIGHYLSLTHTFQRPFGDNRESVECTGIAAWHAAGDGDVREVPCANICPDIFNVMSFHSFSLDEARLSSCQLEEMDFELYDSAGKRSAVLLKSGPPRFLRGDSSSDGTVNLSDALYTLSHLFASGPTPQCADSADANDSGDLDIADPLFTLLYIFSGGLPIPEPHPVCGTDPTPDSLPCDSLAQCGE